MVITSNGNGRAGKKVIKFRLGEELRKAVEYDRQLKEEEERLARRRERRFLVLKWCILTMLALSTALIVVYRDRVSTRVNTVYAALFTGDKGGSGKNEPILPIAKDFKKAKQLIGGAAVVNEEREKILEDLKAEKPTIVVP